MNASIESFKNYFTEQIKFSKKILNKYLKWISECFSNIKTINRLIRNFNDNLDFFNNINKEFSLYHENILKFYDNNFNKELKDNLTQVKFNLKNFINNYEQNKLLDSYESFYEDNPHSESELFQSIDTFSDQKLEENADRVSSFEKTDYRKLFFYEISLFSYEKINFDSNIDNKIFQINEAITENIESLIISEVNQKNYMRNAIKSYKFDLNNDNDILNKIEEIVKLKSFIKDKVGKENFDYKGNSMDFNSSENMFRGKEKYFPPYGWIGIGLKAIGKYEDDNWLKLKDESSEWANSFHPISDVNLIKTMIKEGLKPGKFQDQKDENDKRNYGNKVGIGNYLYQDIKVAESKANTIHINGKKYKFIFMARVKISKIREPQDLNYWILDNEYIRIYRLLIKEIN